VIQECDPALALDDRCVKALICRANPWIKKREFNRAVADLAFPFAFPPTVN
jgi:hypothetical protein